MGKLNIADEFIKRDSIKAHHREKRNMKITTIAISDNAYKLLHLNKLYQGEDIQDCIDRVILKELASKYKMQNK